MSNRKVVTQIGSLPYEDIGEAVAYSLQHDIPFLPELPKRGDAMLNYAKNPGHLSCLEEFKKHEFETVKINTEGDSMEREIGNLEYEDLDQEIESQQKYAAITFGYSF